MLFVVEHSLNLFNWTKLQESLETVQLSIELSVARKFANASSRQTISTVYIFPWQYIHVTLHLH